MHQKPSMPSPDGGDFARLPDHQSDISEKIGFVDIILPCQFFSESSTKSLNPEQRLMFAVLADAINILRRGNHLSSTRKRREFTEAAHWVLLRGDLWPFSFDNVCDGLNIDSDALRQRLIRLTHGAGFESGLAGHHLRLRATPRALRINAHRIRRNHSARINTVPKTHL
jgi:hypothetical protein